MGVHRKKMNFSLLGEQQQQTSVSYTEEGEGVETKFRVCGVCRAEACSVAVVAQPLAAVIPNLCVIPGLYCNANRWCCELLLLLHLSPLSSSRNDHINLL